MLFMKSGVSVRPPKYTSFLFILVSSLRVPMRHSGHSMMKMWKLVISLLRGGAQGTTPTVKVKLVVTKGNLKLESSIFSIARTRGSKNKF